MLLFPTFYAGEGFAGTLIDAMCTGLPVIATNWHNNNEIITHGHNGFLVPIQDSENIVHILLKIASEPNNLSIIRQNCLEEATKYQSKQVIKTLTNQFDSPTTNK
jgi:glycosyltransferase involved in cell wall biosynthesis